MTDMVAQVTDSSPDSAEKARAFLRKFRASEPTVPGVKVEEQVEVDLRCREMARKLCKRLGLYKEQPTGTPAKEALLGDWVTYEAPTIGKKDESAHKIHERTILYLHGGAYIFCSSVTHRPFAWRMSKMTSSRVFVLNYRLAPENKFPAALEDALAAYMYLVHPPSDLGIPRVDPNNLIIMGDSAGGGLTLATLLALRDGSWPLPAGAVTWSPWCDLTFSHASYQKNASFDYLPDFPSHVSIDPTSKQHFYAGDVSFLKHPYVSPIFAQDFGRLPPILIQCGETERLYDECVQFAKAVSRASYSTVSPPPPTTTGIGALVESEESSSSNTSIQSLYHDVMDPHCQSPCVRLETFQDMPHVWQQFIRLPQASQSFQNTAAWIRTVTDGKREAESGWFHINPDGSASQMSTSW